MLLYGTFYFKCGRSKQSILPFLITYGNYTQTPERLQGMPENDTIIASATIFKSNVRETWRVILVSEADMFLSESLRILAERLSQSEIGLPLRQICYYSPAEEVGVFSTEIKNDTKIPVIYINTYNRDFFHCFLVKSLF